MQSNLIESVLANGVIVVLLGVFIRSWISGVKTDIATLFKLHERCVEEKDCEDRRTSMARKVHSEGDDCKAKASIDLLKHYHDDNGKVMGL